MDMEKLVQSQRDFFRTGQTLETLPLEEYKQLSPLFEEDVYPAIALETCVQNRLSQGGAAPASVAAQISLLRESLKQYE